MKPATNVTEPGTIAGQQVVEVVSHRPRPGQRDETPTGPTAGTLGSPESPKVFDIPESDL